MKILTEKQIEDMIYEQELSLDQLFVVRNQMQQYNFDDYDFNYVDDLIEECFDLMSLDELVKLKERISYPLLDKYILRKSVVTNDTILRLDNDDLTYVINENLLSKDELSIIYRNLNRFNLKQDIIDSLFRMLMTEGIVKDESKDIDYTLTNLERNVVNDKVYESYQFEEEELEEDDFYYEDLD